MKKCILFSFYFLLLSSLPAQSKSIKVLSYNIFSLPWPIGKANVNERGKEITKYLLKKDYDIIGIQEAFKKKTYKELLKELKKNYPYSTGKPKNIKSNGIFRILRSKKLINNGLILFSKHPIEFSHMKFFENCKSFDCFSAKSVLLSRIRIKDKSLDILLTHMQAGSGSKNSKIRKEQLKLIQDSISAYPEISKVLIGDLNIDTYTDEFKYLTSYLKTNDLALGGHPYTIDHCLNTITKCKKENTQEQLDHILHVNSDSSINIVNYRSIRPMGIYKIRGKKKLRDLSDHFAVQAEINLY